MAGARLVPAALAEAGDRAVDGALARLLRADAEPRGDARTERLDDDVRLRDQILGRARLARQIALERLLARVERVVPLRCRGSHRIAARLLDAYHSRAEAQQLGGREGAGQVAAQVDHERRGEWALHPART